MGSNLKSLVDYYGQVLVGRAGPGKSMACVDQLERALLDYGLESLHAIDRYLLAVHAAQKKGIPTTAYANTIMATAIYVGEVIRRGSPSTEYRWEHTQESAPNDGAAGLVSGDLSELVLFGASNGAVVAPTDPVLRRIRDGAGAPSIYRFAVASIWGAWTDTPG